MGARISVGLLVLIGLFTIPCVTYAQVVITEIAWMGTSDDANNEWIEVHNRGNETVDVSGWTLSDGGGLMITLTGTLAGNAYGVLERTDDATLPSIAAFQIYTGALANTGRTLTLSDASGIPQDTVVGGTDWGFIGGNNDTKETPQRTVAGLWTTGVATPGRATLEATTAPPSSSPVTTSSAVTVQTKKSGGGGGGLKKQKPIYDGVLSLTMQVPETVYVHQPVTFDVIPTGLGPTMLASLTHRWNFGDTFTEQGKKPVHTFLFPGTYMVAVESSFGKHTAMTKRAVTVLPHTLEMRLLQSRDIEIHNASSREINLAGYTLSGAVSFVFPRHSYVGAGSVIVVPQARVGAASHSVTLFDPMASAVAEASVYQAARPPSPQVVDTVRDIIPVSPVQETVESIPPARESEIIQIGTQQRVSERASESSVTRWWSRLRSVFQ